MTKPRCLTIAGSDSGAGAGIQADLKTFAAFLTYGTSAITAVTVQNTQGVQDVQGIDPAVVVAQAKAVLDDIGADVIKLGMLYSSETILALEAYFATLGANCPRLVLDPVVVTTTGHSLLAQGSEISDLQALIKRAEVLTPNIPEAEALTGRKNGSIKTLAEMEECCAELGELGAAWVYLKGGHLPLSTSDKGKGKEVVNILWDGKTKQKRLERRPFLESTSTHGTGCTLASAIAAGLAKGKSVPDAVTEAADWVSGAIAAAYPIGRGSGPVDHSYTLMPRTLPLPTPASPAPFTDFLIRACGDKWRQYVEHPFPLALADGTVDSRSFVEFIVQDYHFLKHYARTNSLAAYKSESIADIADSTVIVQAVVKEVDMHIAFCDRFGVSKETLLGTQESLANTAYNRFVLDSSAKGDLLDVRVVTAPCLIGYGQAGKRLVEMEEPQVDKSDKNPYWSWISEYGQGWYQDAVQTGIDLLERSIATSPISPQKLAHLAALFIRATELEIAFWDAAMDAAKVAPNGA